MRLLHGRIIDLTGYYMCGATGLRNTLRPKKKWQHTIITHSHEPLTL
jgi:hypothetical protein